MRKQTRCRKQKIYNYHLLLYFVARLWFDVENKRYTTVDMVYDDVKLLWFDVENKRYTT